MERIIDFIPFGHSNAISRANLRILSGMKDREMRQAIERSNLDGEIILNMQDGKGYFRPILPDEEMYVRAWIKAEQGRQSAGLRKMMAAAKTLNEYNIAY